MCNLYSMTSSRDEVRRWMGVADNRTTNFKPMTAIFPGFDAPVIRQAKDGARELVVMSWGFVLLQEGKAPKRVTNVRDDTILTSSFWKSSFAERRCLVPASSYCEPKGEKPAVWHWFALKGSGERPLFAFPGIWRNYTGPMKKDGNKISLDVYAFMTTGPNELTASINPERMPVLLTRAEDFETWLNGSAKDAFALARRLPAEFMRIVQSGSERKDIFIA
ncbi:MAG: SOS response-associated peptidase [Hyphomicrobium sp.]